MAWVLPVVVAGAVVGGVALSAAGSSSASPTLAPRSPAQLLVGVQRSSGTALSGRVSETANLGLPELPGARQGASLSWQSFVTGTHKALVWVNGRDKQRVALTGELSEADIIHNGRDVWTYTSDPDTVTHAVLRNEAEAETSPGQSDYTPAQVAARVLKAVRPSTSVRLGASRRVAKRDAYTLVIRPRDARSTVRKVTIAIDAEKFVPLQVQVFGASSAPAFEIGFTKIFFAAPRASMFNFRQPAGSTVSTDPFGSRRAGHGDERRFANRAPAGIHDGRNASAPKVIGTGWTSVVELTGGFGDHAAGMLDELTSRIGNSNQRLLHTALVNAVFLPDGRVFVGAVSPTLLEHIAATTPR